MHDETLLKKVLLHNLNHILIFCTLFTVMIVAGLSLDQTSRSFIPQTTVLVIVYLIVVVVGIVIQKYKVDHNFFYVSLFVIFYTSTWISLLICTLYDQTSFEFIFIGFSLLILMTGFILVPPIAHIFMLLLIDMAAIYLIYSTNNSLVFYYFLIIMTLNAVAHMHSKFHLLIEKHSSDLTIIDMNELIINTTTKDVLTNLYNNTYVHQQLQQEIIRSKRYNSPLSLVILDIDAFKDINSGYGQVIGDDILSTIGNILLTVSRSTDIVGRFSGNSFILVLANTSLDDTIILAERLRITINNNNFDIDQSITVSIGLKQYSHETVKEYIDLCLQNVDLAKSDGRNTINYD